MLSGCPTVNELLATEAASLDELGARVSSVVEVE
jgi:hypothetical protein